MLIEQIAAREQPGRRHAGTRAQPPIRVGKHVQPLLGRDAGEEADRERRRSASRLHGVAVESDADGHDADPIARDAEVSRS